MRAYLPAPLPPKPPLDLGRFMRVYERAIAAVGRLDGVTTILPSTPLFLYMYVRKEALLSSQIEGTQSSLSDLLLFENHEAPTVELDDVTEVSNYVAAIEHGVSRMRGGFPLSLRLIREMHAILLKSGRGAAQATGRVPPLAELDRRNPAGQRPVRASAAEPAGRVPRCAGALPAQRGCGAAPAHPGGPGPCPVRDDPSLSRRQRTPGSAAHHADPV